MSRISEIVLGPLRLGAAAVDANTQPFHRDTGNLSVDSPARGLERANDDDHSKGHTCLPRATHIITMETRYRDKLSRLINSIRLETIPLE